MKKNTLLTKAIGVSLVSALALFPALSQTKPPQLWEFSSFGEEGYFYQPSDLCADPGLGRIYVADKGLHSILVFDYQGDYLQTIGREGQGPGEFTGLTGIFVLNDSRLAVADNQNNRIQIFDASGQFQNTINPKEVKVAGVIHHQGEFFTVSSYGLSGFQLPAEGETKSLPLISVLDEKGAWLRDIAVEGFAENHPFLRAIKHRVCPALSPDGKLYLAFFASNQVFIFDQAGKKLGEFDRLLPYVPVQPRIVEQKSGKDGVIRMRAEFDIVSRQAAFGPDGLLYILTQAESMTAQLKQSSDPRDIPPPSMRIDVIDPINQKLIRSIPCDPGTKAMTILDKTHFVTIYEDENGEITLKCRRL